MGLLDGTLPIDQASLAAGAKPASLQDQVSAAYEQHRHDVYRYLLLLGLRPAQAQETVQDCFLKMYSALRSGTDIRHPRAWVFTVAHNLAVNLKQSESGTFALGAEGDLPAPVSERNPEQQAIEHQRMTRLRGALESLSEQQRHCLLLRAEGFRYREIADIIGVGTSTVGEFLRRAITRLKRAMSEGDAA